jgi:hypothetical protein
VQQKLSFAMPREMVREQALRLSAHRVSLEPGVVVVDRVVTVVLGLGVAEVSDAGGAAVGEADAVVVGIGVAAGLDAVVGFAARVGSGAAFAWTVDMVVGAAC